MLRGGIVDAREIGMLLKLPSLRPGWLRGSAIVDMTGIGIMPKLPGRQVDGIIIRTVTDEGTKRLERRAVIDVSVRGCWFRKPGGRSGVLAVLISYPRLSGCSLVVHIVFFPHWSAF
jgi:hypothetical protein